jgi:alpha-D-xyloside xylohydrolase
VAVNGSVVDWSGTFVAEAAGDYLFRTYSTGDIKLWLGDKLVIDHWRQNWLAAEDIAKTRLSAGQTLPVRLRWEGETRSPIVRLLFKPPVPNRTTSLWSEVGDGIDYTFVYGPDLDRVVAGYRQLTGEAPMMPRWAFGLWQCRERYKTQSESVEIVDGFRSRGIPLDNIVQDWQYWNRTEWGSHRFDPVRFADPAGWVKALHDRNARLMISVWPKFYPGTANFDELVRRGFLYRPNLSENQRDFLGNVYAVYDAFNPAARKLYWAQMQRALFVHGVDAWWLDATEPEIVGGPFADVAAQVAATESHMHPTALGSGARMLNAFPLVNSEAVYEGQRAAAPNQRVFILTRSGFAGQQRYAAASWSGDITSTWTALRKQIPAGLGFSLSGMPYWTLDSGGFAVPSRFATHDPAPADLEEWRELATRWFEYATFLPILRVHGQWPNREMWEYGGESSAAYRAQLKFDRLRYRLLPYVYSLAGAVTKEGGTFLRPLVMDFRADARAREISDEYMFGPAFLVSPVTAHRVRARDVYLPATAGGWYDLWTGGALNSGNASAPAPFDAIPVHVRAGSIVPFGPELKYTGEKAADPITLYVYAGADGAFTLYEDDGVSNDYEKGKYSRIALRWRDAARTLVIGEREGAFAGMLARRTFQIVVVRKGRAVPFSFAPTPDKVVQYSGAELDVTFD